MSLSVDRLMITRPDQGTGVRCGTAGGAVTLGRWGVYDLTTSFDNLTRPAQQMANEVLVFLSRQDDCRRTDLASMIAFHAVCRYSSQSLSDEGRA